MNGETPSRRVRSSRKTRASGSKRRKVLASVGISSLLTLWLASCLTGIYCLANGAGLEFCFEGIGLL